MLAVAQEDGEKRWSTGLFSSRSSTSLALPVGPKKYCLILPYALHREREMKNSQTDFATPEAEHEADPDYNAKDHPAHGCRHEHVEFEPNLKRLMRISDCLKTVNLKPSQVHLLHKSFSRVPHSGGFCKLSHLGNVQLKIILSSEGSEQG